MRVVLDTNVLFSALISPHGCPHLIAMAEASDADYLVTGDRRAGLLQRGNIGQARIIEPAAFCETVL